MFPTMKLLFNRFKAIDLIISRDQLKSFKGIATLLHKKILFTSIFDYVYLTSIFRSIKSMNSICNRVEN